MELWDNDDKYSCFNETNSAGKSTTTERKA